MKYLIKYEKYNNLKEWEDLSEEEQIRFADLLDDYDKELYTLVGDYISRHADPNYMEWEIDGDDIILRGWTDGMDSISNDEYEDMVQEDEENGTENAEDYQEDEIERVELSDFFSEFVNDNYEQKKIVDMYLKSKDKIYLEFLDLVGMTEETRVLIESDELGLL